MNKDHLEQFVRQFSRSQLQILGFIQVMVPSPTEAEDILQETSVVLWSKWSQFDPSRDFASWACGIARYEILKHLKQRKQKIYLSDPLLEQLADLAMNEIRSREDDQAKQEALARCMGSLSSADQYLLDEKYRSEKTVEEIAKQQAKTPRAVYKRLAVVRDLLQRCIERRIEGATA